MGEKKKAAHQALYRKYRSKSLEEIVGQEHITSTLKNAIKSGRISHAYLFTGPRGVGKTSIARILAHEINEIPYNDDSIELDIIEIDAASNRRIDDIRDLREKVNLAPVQAKYKVYIIDEVHMLTPESFNALLKTLEEPPAHVIFILATTEVHKLPATIISRTQRHSFRAVSKEKVSSHLSDISKKENIEIDREALDLLAEHGEGSFRDSISLLDQISHMEGKITRKMVEDLLGLAPTDKISSIVSLAKSGDTADLIDQLQTLYDQGVSPITTAQQILKTLKVEKPSVASLNLSRELLSINASHNQQLALEVALLEFALSHEEKTKTVATSAPTPTLKELVHSKIKSPQASPVPEPTSEPSKEENDEPKVNTKDTKQTINSGGVDQEQIVEFWKDILYDIKEANSSLYTAMRLAHPFINDDTLLLSFQFSFHQKRVQDPKHLALISDITNKHTGKTFVVETKVDTSLKKETPQQTPQTPDPAHASLIAGIQDIMGGGEIIDAQSS